VRGVVAGGSASGQTGGKFVNGAGSESFTRGLTPPQLQLNDDGTTSISVKELRRINAAFDGGLRSQLETLTSETQQDLAEKFASLALQFTEITGFEIAANILPKSGGFFLADVTLGTPFDTGSFPANRFAVADVHTHPLSSGPGFSGAVTFRGSGTLELFDGDFVENFNRRTNGFVFGVDGSAFFFDQNDFRRDLSSARRNGTPIDSRFPKYLRPIR